MKKDIIVIGGGEHSRIIINSIHLKEKEWNFLGVIDNKKSENDIKLLGSDASIITIQEKYPDVNYIIGIGNNVIRRNIIDKYSKFKNDFITLIHPSAIIADSVQLDSGVFISANAILQPETKINEHAIINTGAIVEHDCTIGKNTHIAPGVVMGGGCNVGCNSLIGLGATVKDHITIGNNVTVGAGAVVINDIEDNQTVVGVPAKPIKTSLSTDYTDRHRL